MSLDAKADRLARESAKARAARARDAPLDPPFPFRRTQFDPFLFDLDRVAKVPTAGAGK